MAKPAKKPAKRKTRYSVHPGVAMAQKWVADLPAKTGRSLEQWVEYIRADGPDDEPGRRLWLKEKHGLGTTTAWWLAENAGAGDVGLADHDPDAYLANAEKYVAAMFAGPKAVLTPIYERLLEMGFGLGPD